MIFFTRQVFRTETITSLLRPCKLDTQEIENDYLSRWLTIDVKTPLSNSSRTEELTHYSEHKETHTRTCVSVVGNRSVINVQAIWRWNDIDPMLRVFKCCVDALPLEVSHTICVPYLGNYRQLSRNSFEHCTLKCEICALKSLQSP